MINLAHEDFGRSLHPRHVEVIRLTANGRTNASIAVELGLSLHTVTDYWRDIRARLGVASAPHAVAVAIARGLVTAGDITVPGRQVPTGAATATPDAPNVDHAATGVTQAAGGPR